MLSHLIPQESFMELAIQEAYACREFEEHPVGAVVVQNGKVISKSGNRTHRDLDPTHHAELVVLREAAKLLGRRDLYDCTLYTTHEPCPMCAAGCIYARIGGIVFGTSKNDIERFISLHPDLPWRSVHVPLKTIVHLSDSSNIIIVEHFMREKCLPLFDTLLPKHTPKS